MSRVGKNVRMYREQAGLTQDQLADRVRYSDASMIHQIEQGLKSPSLEKAHALAIQLGISMSELMGEAFPWHTVTNNASGDHTVIQNIEGHYCAISKEDLTRLLDARLAAFEARLLVQMGELLRQWRANEERA